MSVAGSSVDLPPTEATRIGQILRQSRMQKGMTIDDVSNELHLQVRQIEAIEKGDYSTFSSPAIVKGHLRSFARMYGLDGNNLVHLFESAVPQQKSSQPTKTGAIKRIVLLPGSSNESIILALLVVVIISLLITLAAYLWTAFSSRDWDSLFSMGNVEEIKPVVAGLGPSKIVEPSPPVLSVTSEISPQPVIGSASPNQLAPMQEQVQVPPRDAVLHIAFLDECAVQIKSDDGRLLHDKLHKKGDVFDIVVSARIHISLSRAEAVLVSYNGLPVEIPLQPGLVSAELVLGDVMTGNEKNVESD